MSKTKQPLPDAAMLVAMRLLPEPTQEEVDEVKKWWNTAREAEIDAIYCLADRSGILGTNRYAWEWITRYRLVADSMWRVAGGG